MKWDGADARDREIMVIGRALLDRFNGSEAVRTRRASAVTC